MAIEVSGPDGKVHSFADGTPTEAIKRQMSQANGRRGSLRPQQPRAGDSAPYSRAHLPRSQRVPS